MPLITSSDYPAIRAAILTSLDADDLPDDIISLDLYVGEANRWAESQITITGTEATGNRAKSAAIYMAAALLVPAVEQIASEKDSTGETIQFKSFNAAEKEEKLRQRAAEMIALVNGAEEIIGERPNAVVRPMKSHITVCSIHGCSQSVCGCPRAILVF